MDRVGRLRKAREEVQRAALERYGARAAERAHNKALISEAGPGAADSLQRRELFRDRVVGMNVLRNIQPSGALPFGIERRMGFGTHEDLGLHASSDAVLAEARELNATV